MQLLVHHVCIDCSSQRLMHALLCIKAAAWGVQFSSLEPEILCRLVFVKDVQFTTDQAVAAQPGPGERILLLSFSMSAVRLGVTCHCGILPFGIVHIT